MLPRTSRVVWHRRERYRVALVCLWLLAAPAVGAALETARELVIRGDRLLHQARAEPDEKMREAHASKAVNIFSKAYGLGRRKVKIHALIGAAQGYLLMRRAPSQFPFLWSASSLKRAEKSLQHVLALAHAAANLLMSIVQWRRAESSSSSAALRKRSEHYLRLAAKAGMKVQWAAGERRPGHFAPGDRMLALQYADARGVGAIEDLLFVYQHGADGYAYGTVVNGGTAHPLVGDTAHGRIAPMTWLSGLEVVPQKAAAPLVTITWDADGHRHRIVFQWNGESFNAVKTSRASP